MMTLFIVLAILVILSYFFETLEVVFVALLKTVVGLAVLFMAVLLFGNEESVSKAMAITEECMNWINSTKISSSK